MTVVFTCVYIMHVIVGHLGVGGELVNHKRSLTHLPVLKAEHPSVLFIMGAAGSEFPYFLLFLCDYLSYVVCIRCVIKGLRVRVPNHRARMLGKCMRNR